MIARRLWGTVLGAALITTGSLFAQQRTIAEITLNRNDYTTLAGLLTNAGISTTFTGTEMYTVFAPSNAAFTLLPVGTMDTLLLPANKGRLTSVMTYHVVPGRITPEDLALRIQQGQGMATLTTVNGGTLNATMENGVIVIHDTNGGVATVTGSDASGSNGVVYMVDHVLIPKP